MPITPKPKIHKLYYGHLVLGLGRDENAKESDVGGGTVSGKTKELEELIGPDTLNYLHARAVTRNKAGLHPDDENYGAELVQTAREAGISEETAKKIFKSVVDMVSTPRLAATTPEQLAKATADTINIAISEKIQLSQVPTWLQQKVERARSLETKIGEFEKDAKEAKLVQERAVMDADITLGTLAAYQQDKKLYEITGMANRKKAAKVVQQIGKEYGWDYEQIVEDLSSNETLRQKAKRQLQMIAINDKRLKAQAAADAYHRLVEDAPADLKEKVVARFNRLSVQEGMPPSMVWLKCLWDIYRFYHDLLSLPRWYAQMNVMYGKLAESVTMKRAQLSFTEAQLDEKSRMP